MIHIIRTTVHNNIVLQVHMQYKHITFLLFLLQLIMTLAMTCVVLYIYAVIGFNFFRKFYQQELSGGEIQDNCDSMWNVCIKLTVKKMSILIFKNLFSAFSFIWTKVYALEGGLVSQWAGHKWVWLVWANRMSFVMG